MFGLTCGPYITDADLIAWGILKPDVRAAKDTDPIKRVNNPDNREDYSQYLKGDSAHKGEFCSDEVNQSEDQPND